LERPERLITLRLDADLLDHLRVTGPGWHSRVNDALRAWMDRPAHEWNDGPARKAANRP
jgi:uncharacterized protein (DUF4415 family)